ncbi:ABC transporter permease [Azospirillum sp.]|uniref:ABC transporter permease n=1 Tax=Azospirillum sp. TaxID=34012 RepID=UPI002D6881AE|nr:ABC transporter permease [Azospirillum sp.]HYD66506.1 ABC transporter permease [Azospirillum sp.]
MRRRVLAHRGLVAGLAVLGLILAAAALAPLLAPHDPYRQALMERLVQPVWYADGSWDHPLGTDHLGRDYLSRLLFGARVSLLIGFATALLSGLIGTTLGVCAGYFGGRVDMVVTFLVTVRLSTPVVLVALAVVALFGGSLQVVVGVLGALLWDRFAVVMRSSTLQVRSQEYVTAAQAVGCSVLRVILGEILPNVLNNLIIVATLEMAHAILLEAALSFLGLGVQPPLPSWGLMVAEGRDNLFFEPWLITIPGVALFLLVLSINLVGDGIRDVTAPESRM